MGASGFVTTRKHLNNLRPPYRLTIDTVTQLETVAFDPFHAVLDHPRLFRSHSSPNTVFSINQDTHLRPARCLSQTTSATEQSEFSAQMNSPWIFPSGKQDNTSKRSPLLVGSAAHSKSLSIPRSNTLSNDGLVFLSGTLALPPSKVVTSTFASDSGSHLRANRTFLDTPPTTT